MKRPKRGRKKTINQISLNGNSSLNMKEHNYGHHRRGLPNGDSKTFNSVEPIEEIMRRGLDKPSQVKLDKKALSITELASSGSSFAYFTGNLHPVNISKRKSDLQETKEVFMRGNIPKEIKRHNYEKIINEINQNFVLDWQKIKELENKDIDINLSFESDPESSNLEMIYTIYVMDLNKNDVEIVWNKLRKLFNGVINNMKHTQPRYRKKVEKLERLAVIHIEW